MKNLKVLIVIIMVFGIYGCFEKKEEKNVAVKGVGWVVENMGENVVFSNTTGAYYNFWITYEGDVTFEEIEYIKVTCLNGSEDNGVYWNIDLDKENFKEETKTIGGWYRYWNSRNRNVLPIGRMEVELKTKNGIMAKYTKEIPAPGSISTNGKKYIYNSEDYSTNSEEYIPNLKRAIISSSTKDIVNKELVINYSVNDNRVYNGDIIFYDANKEYIGNTGMFLNVTTGVIKVESFYTNGNNNLLKIKESAINFKTGKSISDIARMNIVLNDGKQYEAEKKQYQYDCLSVSKSFYY